ncbi:MAG: hypothetical protein ACTHNW_01580 [Mucilaginibacter sp.]
MKPVKIKLPKDKYISQIEPFKSEGIDTDSIYHKTVPGCGFTGFAIDEFQENLIACLPNRPVIESKVAEHNKKYHDRKILGVYKGIEVADIRAYLLSDVKYKKILTTPEGFTSKVVKAFKDVQVMRDTYFMLLDECERIVTDVKYRSKIAAPVNEFLRFKRKAMVSATTLPFSDERFKDFKHYLIEPNYDYSKPITVINTNSAAASLHKLLEKLQSEHVCIFINSTRGIAALSKTLNIRSESKAFCAKESVVSLLEKDFKQAYSHFEVKDMAKYNFFTSRYFSAFDIKITDYKPDVIMITDVVFAEHSILDPQTEVIQIAGRLRNGVNSLTHITNFDSDMRVKSEEELLYYLQGCFDTYEGFVSSYEKAVHPGQKDSFMAAIEASPANPYYVDGELNSFMVDNAVHEERVKSYYLKADHLKQAYDKLDKHFKPIYEQEDYTIADKTLYSLSSKQSAKEKYRIAAQLIDSVSSKGSRIVLFAEEQRSILVRKYPELNEAYWLIGLEGLETTDYELPKIKKAILFAKKIDELKRMAIHVQAAFEEYTTIDQSHIYAVIKEIYTKYNCNDKVTASAILKYFRGRRSQGKKKNVYVLTHKIDFSLIRNY